MIEVRNLTKTFVSDKKSEVAVNDLSFESPAGQLMTLLGPSGCGKSTTLRCIAGLERADAGTILISDRIVYSRADNVSLHPAKRDIGMVFQSYAIWPHMSVYQNVEYPLKRRHVRAGERQAKVMEVLNLVGLAELADRPAPHLSGGQQQRVALARAVVAEPKALLLDEPLSNLDANLRRELATYLRTLQRQLGLTCIYVTHDQQEALIISDELALMREGQLVERGAPQVIYQRPNSQFAGEFLGEANVSQGVVAEVLPEHVVVESGRVRFRCSSNVPDLAVGSPLTVLVRPELVQVEEPWGQEAGRPGVNHLEGAIQLITFLGAYWQVHVEVGDGLIYSARTAHEPARRVGQKVSLTFSAEDCVGLPCEDVTAREDAGEKEDAARLVTELIIDQ